MVSSLMNSNTVEFLGVTFDNIGFDGALTEVGKRSHQLPFAYIVTPNVDHLVRIHEGNPETIRLYGGAWISVCDSRVLTALARTVGLRLPTVSGVDLSEAVLDRVAAEGDAVGVIGSSAQALDVVRARWPRITFHHYNPPMNFIHDAGEVRRALDFMRANPARFWLITIGSPQQERLAYLAGREKGISGVGFCVGNTINFLADPGSRAPTWMRRLALEWLYRLIAEPRRLWRRYLVDDIRIVPVFFRAVLTGTAVRQPTERFQGVRIPRSGRSSGR